MHQAIRELDLLSISTIHSFCQSVIQAEGELCGLPVMPEVLVDSKDLASESLHDIWKSRVANDEMLAGIAAKLGWKFKDDLSFVSNALEMPEIRVEPDPEPFEEFFGRLTNAQGRFQPKDRECFRLLKTLANWLFGMKPSNGLIHWACQALSTNQGTTTSMPVSENLNPSRSHMRCLRTLKC